MHGHAPGWQIRCLRCGHIQDAAGREHARLGGASWRRYTLGRCPQCQRIAFQSFERSPDQHSPTTSPSPAPHQPDGADPDPADDTEA